MPTFTTTIRKPTEPTAKSSFKSINEITEHRMPLDEVLKLYGTDPDKGLSEKDVPGLREKYGYNELTPPKRTPGWVKFLKILCQGFALLLWAGAVMCAIAWIVDKIKSGDQAPNDNAFLGGVLAGVVLITSTFTYYQDAKSEAIMESFEDMVPEVAEVIRDGTNTNMEVRDIVPGDIVLVEKGDQLPADILILEAASFKVDNSSLTGEAEPIAKTADCTDDDPLETKNLAFFSTNCVEGTAKGLVIRVGDSTAVGHIANLVTTTGVEETPIKKEIEHFIHIIFAIAMTCGVFFGMGAVLVGYDTVSALVFVISVIVANVPEGLLATVTVSLTLAAKKVAKKNCLVKNIEAVETLGSTSVICSDKTGTLTQNKMTVMHWWFNMEKVKCKNSEEEYAMDFNTEAQGWKEVFRCAVLCSKAKFADDQDKIPIPKREVFGDATESGILKMVTAIGGEETCQKMRDTHPQVACIPFNSSIKYMLSINETPEGKNVMFLKGAPDILLTFCSKFLKDGKEYDIDDKFIEAWTTIQKRFSGQLGERTLAFCHKEFGSDFPKGFKFNVDSGEENFPLDGNVFLGVVALVDPPKTAVPHAIDLCRSAGIRVMMVTGDHPLTARAIARQVGIISKANLTAEEIADLKEIPLEQVDRSELLARVIHGKELQGLSEEEFDDIIQNKPELVFARTTPEQKLRIVAANQKAGRIVGVTGDGVNDSPALKKADIGIAMGISGSDVSKQAADMILLDDNFASIVNGVEEGRLIFDNLKKSIVYTLTSTVCELSPFVAFLTVGIPLPLGTIAIILLDLGTDMVPAISLAYEQAERDIMARMPRDPKADRLVNARLIFLSYAVVGVLQAAAGFYTYFIIMAEHGFLPGKLLNIREQWNNSDVNDLMDSYGQEWSYEQRKKLEYTCQSAYFMTIVQTQWIDLIISKTRVVSIFEQKMINQFLNFALCFETSVTLLVLYLPGTNLALKMYAVDPVYWVPAIPFMVLLFMLDEFRRALIRQDPDCFLAFLTYY